ncbi:hypothetical protein ACEPAF_392 [Sanghuangporus sanghuang]
MSLFLGSVTEHRLERQTSERTSTCVLSILSSLLSFPSVLYSTLLPQVSLAMLYTLEKVILLLAASTGISTLVFGKPIVQIRDPPSSILSFDFAVHLNLSLGGAKIADLDRARAATWFAGLSRRDGSISATNTGADKKYQPTSSSVNLGKNVSVSYGSGRMLGVEYNDTITLSADLVIKEQSIGVANTTSGFAGYDGILGLGPVATTANTVQNTSTVPTVMDNLYAQGKIQNEVFAVSFAPTTTEPNGNGVITFGGVDESKYIGDITYVPITKASPASKYWGIDMNVTYGASAKNIVGSASGIVDTGSTLFLLATDAFNAYTNVTGAKIDSDTGLLKIENDAYEKLESLYFSIGGTTFELTKNAQTFPRPLNEFIGGDNNATYLIVGDLGINVGAGLDFINGYAFLERFFTVYDATNQRVGFAATPNTNSTTN